MNTVVHLIRTFLLPINVPPGSSEQRAALRSQLREAPTARRRVVQCSHVALFVAMIPATFAACNQLLILALGDVWSQSFECGAGFAGPPILLGIAYVVGGAVPAAGLSALLIAAIVRKSDFLSESTLEAILRGM